MIFFLTIFLSFPAPFSSSSSINSTWTGRDLVTAPRSTHAVAMLDFLRSSDRSHFFAETASFTPPLLKESSAVLFLIYMFVFAVRSHLRSFAASLSLFLSFLIFYIAERLVYLTEKYWSFAEILLKLKWVVVVAANWHRHSIVILGNNNYPYSSLSPNVIKTGSNFIGLRLSRIISAIYWEKLIKG